MDISVIFQDEYFLVVDKPPGLVVDPSETQKTGTLAEIMQNDFQIELERGGIVHRLDKDTSGLLVVAKTQAVLDQLQSQFKDRIVKKEYLALVHGKLEKPQKVVGAIGRNPQAREKFIVTPDGKEAETFFEPVTTYDLTPKTYEELFGQSNKNQKRRLERSNYGVFTLVRAFPQTGRTHQIRVHLKHISFPIVGDEKYGGRKTARLDQRWSPRQFLHAAKLSLNHPVTGKPISFESPLPRDLKEVLNLLSVHE